MLECGDASLYEQMTRTAGKRSENDIRTWWEQMLSCVKAMHAEGILHLDLKPANFVFVRGALKVIDLGIAKTVEPEATSVVRENQIGSINYMAPEQFVQFDDGFKVL